MPSPTLAASAHVRRPRRRRPGALLAAGVAAALAAAPAAAQPFTSLTFFGDSYVDTGNAFRLTGGAQAAPPYSMGRFSNGRVFTNYLATALGRPDDARAAFRNVVGIPQVGVTELPSSGNFAIGGARTDNLQGTGAQLAFYLNRPGATPTTRTDATGLYVLFVGGNDLRDAGDLPTAALREAAAFTAAQNVITQASTLVGAGARNVVLFTLQSPGVLPEALPNPALAATRDSLASIFNATLAAGILGLQGTAPVGTTLFNFRLDNLFANLRYDALRGGGRYGVTNLTTPCLLPPALPGASPCDESAFVDFIHPTTRVHRLIGRSLARYVTTGQNVALVPEPATVALVGGGLLALGAAARRRRAA